MSTGVVGLLLGTSVVVAATVGVVGVPVETVDGCVIAVTGSEGREVNVTSDIGLYLGAPAVRITVRLAHASTI